MLSESAMNASWAQSTFGMGFINLSGTCATTKLIQCRGMGVYQCEVSRKFQKRPEEAPDLMRADFLARKSVLDQVQHWCDEQDGKPSVGDIYRNEWCPILYDWEVAKSSAKKLRDRGHIIFTDLTLTRFLSVMCFGPKGTTCGHESYEDDYATIAKTNAHRFLCLAKYLYHDENKPQWIRATYTTYGEPLPPEFFDFGKPTTDSNTHIWHIPIEDLIPSLLPGEIERIDNLIAQSPWTEPPPASLKQEVMGSKEDRPEITTWKYANTKTGAVCGNCGKTGNNKMPMCSQCKLVRYCNKECQVAAWKMHRQICKASQAKKA
ncbi:hypothetical protein NM688_g4210 [Phlebia brevispora]|uniref:Uncharacterized protein n=1 Tax=Phlebia brevispora TaxID=194682 RepID=A0ACC1T3L0_9APHY|nr:hypothetical protein NM688_g4210 [Phlebia brevispora]